MSQHLRDFTHHLIENREGAPVAVATIVSVFTNLGNPIPGADAEEQRARTRELLRDDERLAFSADGDTFDTPNDGETAEEFAARREAGLKALESK